MEGGSHEARGASPQVLAEDVNRGGERDVGRVVGRSGAPPVSQEHGPEDYAEEDPGYEDHSENSETGPFEEDDAYHDGGHNGFEDHLSDEEGFEAPVVNQKRGRAARDSEDADASSCHEFGDSKDAGNADAFSWYETSKKHAGCSAYQRAGLMLGATGGGSAAKEAAPTRSSTTAPSFKHYASLEAKLFRSRQRVQKNERFITELLEKVSTLEGHVLAKDKIALSVKKDLNNLRHTMTYKEDLVRGAAFCPVLMSTLVPEDEVIVFRGKCACQCMVHVDVGMSMYKKFLDGERVKCPTCNLIAHTLTRTTVGAASQLFIWQKLENVTGCDDHQKMLLLRKEHVSNKKKKAKEELLAGYKSVMKTIGDMTKMDSSP